MAETIKIGGELESMATGKVVAAASAIKDKARGKTQDIINTDVEDALASQTSRIDDTNVKVDVNERKINSVKELVESHEFEQGIVQYANDVYCNVDGLDSANVQSALGELDKKVSPLEAAIDRLATKTEQIQALSIKVINGKRYLEISVSDSTPSPEPSLTTSLCGTALCGYAICGTN